MSIGRVFCIVSMVALGASVLGVPGFAQQPASGGASGGGASQGGTGAPGGGTGTPGAVEGNASAQGVGTSTNGSAQPAPAAGTMIMKAPPKSGSEPAQQ